MARKLIDISVPRMTGIASDPPGYTPKITYLDHKATAAGMASFFDGMRTDQLPGGEGWAIEQLQMSTHVGTHLDAPYHHHSTMNDGARAITIAVGKTTGSRDAMVRTLWWPTLGTLLLALARGAGVAGLAAMPAHWQAEGLHWYRPLLAVPGQDLRRWLEQMQAPWVEDPSNADERFTRNRIRHKLLPVLEAVFPQFRTTFARSCAHAAQAKDLLAALAQQDAATTGLPPLIAALQKLPTERQTNLLRYWLLHHHGTTPSTAQIQALLVQIAA